MQINGNRHLTYCTNIHPSKGWDALLSTLKQYVPVVKKRLSPDGRFGVGLCLSNQQAEELLAGDTLAQFQAWMREEDIYVFTINGFVHKEFHDPHIKDTIHTPDWRSEDRVSFSKRLVDVLAALLPDDISEGSISTQPLSYKYWEVDPKSADLWQAVTDNLVRVVAYMARTHERTGKLIHIDLEAEPDCLIENAVEMCNFFDQWLLTYGAVKLAGMLDCTVDVAREKLLNHVQVCYDTCHVAVAYESAADILDEYEKRGIKVGKIQVSSALKIPLTDEASRASHAEWLSQFAEDKFLHQVIQRNQDGSFQQYRDLPKALPHIQASEAVEWRIHYHVPIFVDSYRDGTSTTQDAILDAFAELKRRNYTDMLEVETYTWDVLPPDKRLDLADSIERELNWIRTCLG